MGPEDIDEDVKGRSLSMENFCAISSESLLFV